MDKTISLVGVALDLGARNLGVSSAPSAYRQNKIIEKLQGVGLKVNDLGDISPADRANLTPGDPKLRYLDEIVRVSNELAAKTSQALKDGTKPVVLGGDHSTCLGAVAGASKALEGKLGLIYIDAHGDLNTADTTLTGNIHGMHLASLLGLGDARLVNVGGEGHKLTTDALLHIAGSDFDDAEIEIVRENNIRCFSMFDLLSHGLSPLLKLVDELASKYPNIWVSLDLDSIDETYAPAAGMPNAKGLNYREISAIAEYIGAKCNVVGVDVVEYNPTQDINFKTAELAIELISNFFGEKYSWYSNYLKSNQL